MSALTKFKHVKNDDFMKMQEHPPTPASTPPLMGVWLTNFGGPHLEFSGHPQRTFMPNIVRQLMRAKSLEMPKIAKKTPFDL